MSSLSENPAVSPQNAMSATAKLLLRPCSDPTCLKSSMRVDVLTSRTTHALRGYVWGYI